MPYLTDHSWAECHVLLLCRNEESDREEREREGFVCGVRTQTDSDGGVKPLENPAKDMLRMRNNSGVKTKENGAEG
jgi:hypothetical protein